MTGVIDRQRRVFESLGCVIDDAEPDFTHADEVFKIWRAWRFELAYGELLKTHRHLMKDTVIWNIEAGMKLTGPQIGRAECQRTALYHRLRRFMETYEFLILPVSQVPPFDVQQRYVTAINGTTYGDLYRLDEILLLHHGCRSAGHLRASRLHARRFAGGGADRRAAPR